MCHWYFIHQVQKPSSLQILCLYKSASFSRSITTSCGPTINRKGRFSTTYRWESPFALTSPRAMSPCKRSARGTRQKICITLPPSHFYGFPQTSLTLFNSAYRRRLASSTTIPIPLFERWSAWSTTQSLSVQTTWTAVAHRQAHPRPALRPKVARRLLAVILATHRLSKPVALVLELAWSVVLLLMALQCFSLHDDTRNEDRAI